MFFLIYCFSQRTLGIPPSSVLLRILHDGSVLSTPVLLSLCPPNAVPSRVSSRVANSEAPWAQPSPQPCPASSGCLDSHQLPTNTENFSPFFLFMLFNVTTQLLGSSVNPERMTRQRTPSTAGGALPRGFRHKVTAPQPGGERTLGATSRRVGSR